VPGRIAKVLHRGIALVDRVMRANAQGQSRMDAVMYLSSALDANRALEAECSIHSTGAGSSRAWVRTRRQGLWFENTKLNIWSISSLSTSSIWVAPSLIVWLHFAQTTGSPPLCVLSQRLAANARQPGT